MGQDYYICGICSEPFGSWGDSWDCDVCKRQSCPRCTHGPGFLLDNIENESPSDTRKRMDALSRLNGFWCICNDCEEKYDTSFLDVCSFFAGRMEDGDETPSRQQLEIECIKECGFAVKRQEAVFYILEKYKQFLHEQKTDLEWHLACEEFVSGKEQKDRIKEMELAHAKRKIEIELKEKRRLEQLEKDIKQRAEKNELLEKLKDLSLETKLAIEKLVAHPHNVRKFT
jgi:hypothetical protein